MGILNALKNIFSDNISHEVSKNIIKQQEEPNIKVNEGRERYMKHRAESGDDMENIINATRKSQEERLKKGK